MRSITILLFISLPGAYPTGLSDMLNNIWDSRNDGGNCPFIDCSRPFTIGVPRDPTEPDLPEPAPVEPRRIRETPKLSIDYKLAPTTSVNVASASPEPEQHFDFERNELRVRRRRHRRDQPDDTATPDASFQSSTTLPQPPPPSTIWPTDSPLPTGNPYEEEASVLAAPTPTTSWESFPTSNLWPNDPSGFQTVPVPAETEGTLQPPATPRAVPRGTVDEREGAVKRVAKWLLEGVREEDVVRWI